MDLITDRTESDVLLGNEKGQYSYTDLIRVESAVNQLRQLASYLDIYPDVRTKTDWELPGIFSVQSWPVQSQMERYLQNVHTLCEALGSPHSMVPASMEQLDWAKANAIEQALQLAYDRIQSITKTFQYSGEFFAGEEISL